MSNKERTIALIRARAQAHLVAPRRRLPRQQHPTTIAMDYGKALRPLVERTTQLLQHQLYPMLPQLLAEHEAQKTRKDAGLLDLAAKMHALAKETTGWVEPKQLWWLANQFGQQTSDFQKKQLQAATRAALGVDLATLEPNITPHIGAWVGENVSLIQSIPQQYLSDVGDIVQEGIKSGTRWETMSQQLQDRHGITERRADLIARDQTGKLYGKLNQERQEALGVTGYIWRTSMDERVRDEHEEREGQAFDWNDPPDDGAPGEPIQCRCYAEPDFSAIIDGADD